MFSGHQSVSGLGEHVAEDHFQPVETPYARHEHERETDVGRGVSNRNGSAFGIQHTFSPPKSPFSFMFGGGRMLDQEVVDQGNRLPGGYTLKRFPQQLPEGH